MELVRRLPAEIDEVLSRGGIILTSNQRAAPNLSSRIRPAIAAPKASQAGGRQTSFAWDTWLSSLWHEIVLEGRTNYLVLSRSQELQIWRSAITADPDSNSLQSVEALATIASQAWQAATLRLLRPVATETRLVSAPTPAALPNVGRRPLAARLKTSLYLTQSELEAAIASLVAADGFRPPSSELLLLIGFDTFTPATGDPARRPPRSRRLNFTTSFRTSHTPLEVHLATTRDLDDEFVQAALWLREHLTDHPEARIAAIHPDIASERAELDRVFRRILAPELQDITADLTSSPYEFSLGHPLSQQPMIAHRPSASPLGQSPLSASKNISQLLLSPFFARHASERQHRAEFRRL